MNAQDREGRFIRVGKNLFCGSGDALAYARGDDFSVVHAAKDPWHREILGYTTHGAPKEHPEYLVAQRGRELFLNLVDPADKKYIPIELVQTALKFIATELRSGQNVFIHCNKGESRAPSLALLYLFQIGQFPMMNYCNVLREFRSRYPHYRPGTGFSDFVSDWISSANKRPTDWFPDGAN